MRHLPTDGVRRLTRQIFNGRRSAEGKNTRATRARVVVQRRLETILAIPFTDSPNGGGILLDVVTQEHHALLLVCSAPQDLGAPSDLPRDLTILQEFLQE